MIFEQAILLAMVSIAILFGIIAYDLHGKRREVLIAVRRKALNDAADALGNLELVASRAADEALRRPRLTLWHATYKAASSRAYHYGRAKMIVGSIPVDRV